MSSISIEVRCGVAKVERLARLGRVDGLAEDFQPSANASAAFATDWWAASWTIRTVDAPSHRRRLDGVRQSRKGLARCVSPVDPVVLPEQRLEGDLPLGHAERHPGQDIGLVGIAKVRGSIPLD